ncbi:MAG: hypothetical protein MI976_09640 [Pseudomonadales bacterium]|nr:hypothetical protein [Pseudomonadales bacterium]
MKISEHVSAILLATVFSAMPLNIQANEEYVEDSYQEEYVEDSYQDEYAEDAYQDEYVEEEYVEESYSDEDLAYSQEEPDNDAAWEQEVKAYCKELSSYELPEYQQTYLKECIDSQLGQ